MITKLNKVVLAYSGGLDTSVVIKWLQENYGCEVITFTANLGQSEELECARQTAKSLGVKEIFLEDMQETFVRDYVFPMMRANPLYEGTYLLGSAISRPLIARRQVEIALLTGADAVAHGATGKGNDQIRFELAYTALAPNLKVIAPWREWNLNSRSALLDFAHQNQIKVAHAKSDKRPYSVDSNLLHTSYEAEALEDPATPPDETLFTRSTAPEKAPDQPTVINITFEHGDPVAIDSQALSPATLLDRLNDIGGSNGIGRVDMVENRITGMKTRGVYETPGGTVLLHAHRAIESLTLDREAAHLKDELMPRYAKLIYNGLWFSPEREMLQAAIDVSQQTVNGTVRLKLYKGSVQVTGRWSEDSHFNRRYVTFEADDVYNHADASGFIKLSTLRFRLRPEYVKKPTLHTELTTHIIKP